MKRTTIVAATVILVSGIGLIVALNHYKLALIHVIVENALVQKAPASYPYGRIRQVFEENYRKARRLGRENVYLDRLLKVSQRLEKIQRLESRQVEEVLLELDPGT
ncbi:MAG: hypothetical protein ACE15E_11285 [Acidobacteriota bacterium]